MEASERDIISSGKRDKLEIMAAILALIQKPTNATHIMGHLNFNNEVLTKYLKYMVERRLIEKNEAAKTDGRTKHLYQSTEKGRRLLEIYCEILRLIYGENYLRQKNNLAVACLQYCKDTESNSD